MWSSEIKTELSLGLSRSSILTVSCSVAVHSRSSTGLQSNRIQRISSSIPNRLVSLIL
ncbi:hypothetical protein Anas_03623 [Armadillidium nasatum]|uniref:Uncharacterized protein n=1 Tax=Armadillidium nasatum TaxID=96803 RepID=A0A5N5T9Y8_9CRUS|nr:hypothetical protein Anas_03623 [Armadillidium nasatum]